MRWKLRANNPAALVDPPKVERPNIQIAEPRQLREVLRAMQGREWYLPTLIGMMTGMRRGEVLALQWRDFDEAGGVLIVRRALARVRDSEVILKETKSGRVRTVAISPTLCRLLRWHRRRTEHTMPEDWICSKPDGRHLAPGGLTHAFTRAASKLGVPVSFHSVRHTQATELIAAGIPVKVVSERLGHSTVQITQDVYAHVLPHSQREAAAVADALMRAKR